MRLHRSAAVAAVPLIATLLLACGSQDKPHAKASSSPTSTLTKQDQFLSAVHQAGIESWATAAPTDDEIAAYPPRWCGQLDEGHSVANILGVRSGLYPSGSNWGTKIADTYEVFVIAVTDYCPQYRAEVVQQIQSTGTY